MPPGRTDLIAVALAAGTGLVPGAQAQQPSGPFGNGPLPAQAAPAIDLVGKRLADTDLAGTVRAGRFRTHRVLRSGDMATMDMRPDRLTIVVDDAGIIVRTYRG